MHYLLIRHRVADFARWKPVYDAHASARRAAGLDDVLLLRDAGDPNQVVLLFRVTDLGKATAFAESTNFARDDGRRRRAGPTGDLLPEPGVRQENEAVMSARRILIYGNSGSGKTTMAAKPLSRWAFPTSTWIRSPGTVCSSARICRPASSC